MKHQSGAIFLIAIVLSAGVHALVYLGASAIYASHRPRFEAEADRARREMHESQPIRVTLEPPAGPVEPFIPLGGALEGKAEALNEIDVPREASPRESEKEQAAMARQSGLEAQPQPSNPQPPDEPSEEPVVEARPVAPPPPPPAIEEPLVDESPVETNRPAPPVEVPPAVALAEAMSRTPEAKKPEPDPVAEAEPARTPPVPPSPTTPASSGDPLPQAESDSDPFGEPRTAVVTAGKVEARFGRKIKSVRPRISLAGEYDVALMSRAAVTLRVKTDAAGNVASAKVVRSSGSVSIDQPVLVAIYDWWFEPPPGPKGEGLPDDFLFTLTFR